MAWLPWEKMFKNLEHVHTICKCLTLWPMVKVEYELP
jgi:hypothetical protein